MEPWKILADQEIDAIHNATLRILGEVGLVIDHASICDQLADSGATFDEDRVQIPPDLVEKSIQTCTKQIRIRGRNGSFIIIIPLLNIFSGQLEISLRRCHGLIFFLWIDVFIIQLKTDYFPPDICPVNLVKVQEGDHISAAREPRIILPEPFGKSAAAPVFEVH